MNKARRIGLILSVSHLLGLLLFIKYMFHVSGRDGQGPLLWVYWLIIDFPVSILVVLLFALNVTTHYVLYFVHGVLGTVWWYYLPIYIHKMFSKFKKDTK